VRTCRPTVCLMSYESVGHFVVAHSVHVLARRSTASIAVAQGHLLAMLLAARCRLRSRDLRHFSTVVAGEAIVGVPLSH
jgi:hypothetical protein